MLYNLDWLPYTEDLDCSHDYNGYLRGAPTFTQQRPSWQKNPILDELDEYADALFPAGKY